MEQKTKKATNQQFSYVALAKIEPSDYQRPTEDSRVDSIVKNFDEAKLGTLTISKRDGRYFAIDGQHRLAALRILSYTHAVCEILTGLTHEDEADYFRRQGEDKRALRPLDLFKAGLIAKDANCLAIEEIVRSNSFQIGFAVNDFAQIGAVQALFTIADEYGYEILDDTLSFISNTWFQMVKATRGECLLGVAEFLNRYGNIIDPTDLDEQLSNRFLSTWYEYRDVVGRTQLSKKARNTFCRVLVKHYNKGLGSKSKKRIKWVD